MKKNFYRNLACMLIFTGALCIATSTKAQVTVGSKGIPNAGALLDMKQKDKTDGSANSDKGLGLPRVALTAVDKLDPCVATTGNATKDDTAKKSHIGLTVYNTTDNTSTDATLIEGVYAWDGTMWTQYSGSPAGGAENGLSMNGRKVILGGPLNQPTTITGSGANTLTLAATTTVQGNLTVTATTTTGTTSTGSLTSTGFTLKNNGAAAGKILTSDTNGKATWTALPTLPSTATNTEPWRIQGGTAEATLPSHDTYVTGKVAIGGATSSGAYSLHVTGNTNTVGNSTVTGNSTTVTSTVTENETVGGTLAVTGATTLAGNLTSNGTTALKATNISGATTIATTGSLTLAGNGAGNGKVLTSDASGKGTWTTPTYESTTASNGVSLSGKDVQLGGTLAKATTITGTAANDLTLNTPTSVGSTLAVTGATTLTGNLTSNGITTTKATNVTGALKYTNTTPTVGQYLSATATDGTVGWTTLPATATNTEPWRKQGGTAEATAPADNAYMTGNVAIGSNTSGTNKLQVTGNTNIIGTATTTGSSVVTGNSKTATSTVTGNETIGGTLAVTGATTLTGNLTSNGVTTTKVTNVTGALTYTGTTPTAGHVLTSSDATGNATWSVPAVNGATNGTQVVSNKVELGGALTKGTTIAQAANSFAVTSTNTSTSSATFGTSNAVLNLTSPNKGFMPPRVALTGATDNTTIPLTAADKGMTVYNTGTAFKEGLYTWSGAAWTELITQLPAESQVNYLDLAVETKTKAVNWSSPSNLFGGAICPWIVPGEALTSQKNDITVPESGSYAFSFRVYGIAENVPEADNGFGGTYYFALYKNGASFVDSQEITIVYSKRANTPSTDVDGYKLAQTATVFLGGQFNAGDTFNIRVSCYDYPVGKSYPFTMKPGLSSDVGRAARSSLIFWKL